MRNIIEQYLIELGFHPNEVGVYMALTKLGEAKASTIAKTSDLPRTTAISILEKLKDHSYVTTNTYHGTTYYWIESPEVLVSIFQNKTRVAETLRELLRDLYRTDAHFPAVQVFDTKTNIRRFIERVLESVPKRSIIMTIDTPQDGNYAKIYPERIESLMFDIKHRRELQTHTLVPAGSMRGVVKSKLVQQSIVIRELPTDIMFSGSIWLLANMLVLFSGAPPFAVCIKHPGIVAGVRGLFEYLWLTSKQYKIN